MRLSRMKQTNAKLEIDFGGGDVLHVEYDPQAYTAAREEELAPLMSQARPGKWLVKTVEATILRWDLEDDEGNVIPLTEEGLAGVPTSVLTEVYKAVQEHQRPNPTTSEVSGSF